MRNPTLKFGLVAIKVRLYKSHRDESGRLRKLCKTHKIPIQQPNWCQHRKRRVPASEVVMGYRLSPNRYVVFDPDEVKTLRTGDKDLFEVIASFPEEAVDPALYFGESYHLRPFEKRRDAKPYRLMAQALEESGHLLMVHVVLGTTPRPAFIKSEHSRLRLILARNPAWLTTVPDENIYEGEVNTKELATARAFVETVSRSFSPEQLAQDFDDLQGALQRQIEQRINEEEVETVDEEPTRRVDDLMEALERSIELAKQQKTQANGQEKEKVKTT
jgi:DNA end-binding protein Ku